MQRVIDLGSANTADQHCQVSMNLIPGNLCVCNSGYVVTFPSKYSGYIVIVGEKTLMKIIIENFIANGERLRNTGKHEGEPLPQKIISFKIP